MFRDRPHPHRPHAQRRRAATVLLALVALLWAATATPPAEAQPAPTMVTFEYTGAAQSWTVPPGVTQATFDVYGAQGGGVRFNNVGRGLGGRATVTLPVTPGSVVTIMVGGQGQDVGSPCTAPGRAGGFNGGGAGGSGGFCPGAGGGGASDVRIGGSDLTHRVLVAGGGGGAGITLPNLGEACHGGSGGGLTGTPGSCVTGGAGGNQDGTSGSGQLGQGSDGANGHFGMGTDGAGGGGGGYYGGAGGTNSANPPAAGGGGGGSGFGPAGAVLETGVRSGNGRVTVTYTGVLPTVTSLSPATGPTTGGTAVTISGSGFEPGQTTVSFGAAPATGVSCASATSCIATSPAGIGIVTVTVTTPGGTSNALPYTYTTPPPPPPPPPPAAPTVSSLSPRSGPTTGGTMVIITGSGFAPGQTTVTFGGIPATEVSCPSPTTCIATSPPETAGPVSVRVTVGGRTSPDTPATAFTYVPVPPPPSPSPSPPQPMTLTVAVWWVLPPLVSEAQIEQTVVPVVRAAVQARIGDTLCGTGVTDGQGRVQLVVAADPPARGCGRDGALVTFRVNGVVVLGEVAFVPGGSTFVALRLPNPMYLIP